MFLAQSYGRSSYRYLEMLTTAAVIYWVLSILLELMQARRATLRQSLPALTCPSAPL